MKCLQLEGVAMKRSILLSLNLQGYCPFNKLVCVLFMSITQNYSSLPITFQERSYEMCGLNVAVKQC